jgi:hypothetical protein
MSRRWMHNLCAKRILNSEPIDANQITLVQAAAK